MTSMRPRVAWTVLVLAATLIAIALTQFNLSARQEPGPVETAIGNKAKRFYIHRASRHGIPPRPVDLKTSIENGATYYGLECSICHAVDGRGQTEPGQWEYPRAADLSSKHVQSYSDEELFWIIQNGIRYTGMPSFAKVETPDHIWDLVNYVRTLPGNLQSERSGNQ